MGMVAGVGAYFMAIYVVPHISTYFGESWPSVLNPDPTIPF